MWANKLNIIWLLKFANSKFNNYSANSNVWFREVNTLLQSTFGDQWDTKNILNLSDDLYWRIKNIKFYVKR